jgi:cystathionine beta-lyase
MGRVNFDEIIDRKHTNSLKHDFSVERKKPDDVIPLWVADMDFRTPIEVRQALVTLSNHGIFGYSEVKDEYYDILKKWFLTRHQFKIENKWVVKVPGVVFALATLVKSLTNELDKVLICSPVYYPFSEVIHDNNRVIVDVPLINDNNHYSLDYINIEKEIVNQNIKLMIFCSPHNPVGRVWTKDELITLGNICKKNNCIIISDEIHMDLIYKGFHHEVFQNIKEDFKDFIITCTSASKTFNLAGLVLSNIIIANDSLREKFNNEINRIGYSQHNIFGLIATQTAYKECSYYVDELIEYLNGNLKYIKDFISKNLNKIKVVEPEGTYLVWLDFSGYNIDSSIINDLIINKAHLWLDKGELFGETGTNYQRVNIATPRSVIIKALNNLKDVFENL